jgi:hypothetical protein
MRTTRNDWSSLGPIVMEPGETIEDVMERVERAALVDLHGEQRAMEMWRARMLRELTYEPVEDGA